MKPWRQLAEQHTALRQSARSQMTALRDRLRELTRLAHCNPGAQGRFGDKKIQSRTHVEFRRPTNTRAAEPLKKLREGITSAELTLQALHENDSLLKLTIRIDGTTDGRPWAFAIHLDSKPMGGGAGSHSLLHCHVGPSLEAPPKVRVPLPPVGAEQLLDWALSVVIEGWEPERWTEEDRQKLTASKL